jgi:hypothetical protein
VITYVEIAAPEIEKYSSPSKDKSLTIGSSDTTSVQDNISGCSLLAKVTQHPMFLSNAIDQEHLKEPYQTKEKHL